MIEIDEEDLKKTQQDFLNKLNEKPKKEPEEVPLKSDEWICDHCKNKNIMTDDPKSATCTNCRTVNETITYLIQMA